ncbi:MAG TPA: DUF748 domain-containing protein [Gammaproteobacteria bacterium]|nr:DUF748 domain-containing protein [Gammaproteobacteria bacterium]
MKSTAGLDPPQDRAFPQHSKLRRGLLFGLGAVALAVGLYALAGFYGAPWLVDRWLAQYRAAETGREISLQGLRFNPFTLVAEIVTIEARNGEAGAALAADRIVVDFAAASLAGLRPVVSSLVIEGPRIELESIDRLPALGRRALATGFGYARIDRFELTGGTVAAGSGTDRPLVFTRLDLSLTEFDRESDADARFSLDATTAAGAGIAGNGTLAANLERADGQLRVEALELATAADRLGGTIDAAEPRGRIDLTANFSATSLPGEPRLELTDARLAGSQLSLTPVDGLTVTADTADATGRFTLVPRDDGIDLSGRLEVERIRLAVTDARVVPAQSFTFDQAAILATIDADSDELTLNLGGSLSDAGEATVTIRALPEAAGGSRVSIDAARLPATALSPYAIDTLGRGLTDGQADLRLEYSLRGNRVDGSLRIVTRELAFSERSEARGPADGGTSVELAAALLENTDGVIEIDLPFAGNTGSPRDAAAAALEARIAAVTETPFDALVPVIGDEAVNAVPFLPGDAALTDRALATIGQLAAALNARPRLGMRVHAGYEPRVDRDALARQQIELHVELATAGPGGRQPAAIDVGSLRVRDVLDEFAGERLRPERLAALRSRYTCEGELASVCERAYYEAIFDALVVNEEITSTALNRLGRFRALSVVDALTQRGVAVERIELVTGGQVADTAFGIGLPVELTVSD